MEYRLPWEAESPNAARQLLSDYAEDRLPEMEVDELALMVSEVVTNAVKHGSPEADGNIGLRIDEEQDVLRVVVTDGGHDFDFDPGSIEDSDRNEHFGLLLVDRLADRWGLSVDGRKAVWLEVDTPRSH